MVFHLGKFHHNVTDHNVRAVADHGRVNVERHRIGIDRTVFVRLNDQCGSVAAIRDYRLAAQRQHAAVADSVIHRAADYEFYVVQRALAVYVHTLGDVRRRYVERTVVDDQFAVGKDSDALVVLRTGRDAGMTERQGITVQVQDDVLSIVLVRLDTDIKAAFRVAEEFNRRRAQCSDRVVVIGLGRACRDRFIDTGIIS